MRHCLHKFLWTHKIVSQLVTAACRVLQNAQMWQHLAFNYTILIWIYRIKQKVTGNVLLTPTAASVEDFSAIIA